MKQQFITVSLGHTDCHTQQGRKIMKLLSKRNLPLKSMIILFSASISANKNISFKDNYYIDLHDSGLKNWTSSPYVASRYTKSSRSVLTNIDKNRSILFMMAELGEQHFNQTKLLKAEHSTWCEIQRGVRSVRRQAKLLQVAMKAH